MPFRMSKRIAWASRVARHGTAVEVVATKGQIADLAVDASAPGPDGMPKEG
jgi:hypothetical protein